MDPTSAAIGRTPSRRLTAPRPEGWTSYLAAILLVAGATVLCEQARPYLSPVNMVMGYLLVVVIAALFLGRKPAILSAFFGVLAFDFFFVPPRLSFRIAEKEYLVTFLTLFTVGVVISTLVAKARESLEALQVRERHTTSLYHLSRDLSAAPDTEAVLAVVISNLEASLGAQVAIFLPADGTLSLAAASAGARTDTGQLEIAQWCLRSRRTAGRGSDSYTASDWSYFPLKALADTLGVLCVRLEGSDSPAPAQLFPLLKAFATQIAMALARLRLLHQAQEAQILKGRQNLERALLNSISHDLRTPLAVITGSLSAVLDQGDRLSRDSRTDLLQTAREEAERLNRLVGNLLDMSRLEAGALQLRLEPCSVQDLVGCALAAVEPRQGVTQIAVRLEPELPLVPLDFVLMVQVLVNLLDNALKYAPADREVEVAAGTSDGRLLLEVSDHGPGVPQDDLGRIFDKFYRTPVPEVVGGTGLGLSICKGIVEAHGGSISAANRAGGGLKVSVNLRLGDPATHEELPDE